MPLLGRNHKTAQKTHNQQTKQVPEYTTKQPGNDVSHEIFGKQTRIEYASKCHVCSTSNSHYIVNA